MHPERKPIGLSVPHRKVKPAMTKQCSSCGGFCGKVCQRKNVRSWVDLTDKEISEFDVDPVEAKKMLAKLKEKNGG